MIDYIRFINSKSIQEYYRRHPEFNLADENPWMLLRLVLESIYISFDEKLEALEDMQRTVTDKYIAELDDGEKCSFSNMVERTIVFSKQRLNHYLMAEDDSYYYIHGDSNDGSCIECDEDLTL